MKKIFIFILFILYVTTIYSQETLDSSYTIKRDTCLTGKVIDCTLSYSQLKRDSTLSLVLDGFCLSNRAFCDEIEKIVVSCTIRWKNDNLIIIKSDFVYYLNGVRIKKLKRNKILSSLDNKSVCVFKAYTPNEALEAFNIQAKHGLIEIEECKE